MRIEYFVLVCYEGAGAALYWRIFLYAYLVMLQIVGIMLAFQIRKVKIKSLKDSTFVVANVYISSIVIVIFILVTFALRTFVNAYSGIFAVGTLILTTMFLALTFVPKVCNLWCICTCPLYCDSHLSFSYAVTMLRYGQTDCMEIVTLKY